MLESNESYAGFVLVTSEWFPVGVSVVGVSVVGVSVVGVSSPLGPLLRLRHVEYGAKERAGRLWLLNRSLLLHVKY